MIQAGDDGSSDPGEAADVERSDMPLDKFRDGANRHDDRLEEGSRVTPRFGNRVTV